MQTLYICFSGQLWVNVNVVVFSPDTLSHIMLHSNHLKISNPDTRRLANCIFSKHYIFRPRRRVQSLMIYLHYSINCCITACCSSCWKWVPSSAPSNCGARCVFKLRWPIAGIKALHTAVKEHIWTLYTITVSSVTPRRTGKEIYMYVSP